MIQNFVISPVELGSFRAGSRAELFGPAVAAVAGGVGTVLVVIRAGVLFPQLARL